MLGVLVVVGIAVLVVLVIAAAQVYEKKRTRLLAEATQELGLVFMPAGDPAFQSRLAGFQLFEQGHSRKTSNMIMGETDDVSIAIFDYQFTTNSGKNASTWKQTVAALHSPQLSLPHFSLRPEGLLLRMIHSIGVQDVDFKTNPEFSRMFQLQSADEERARAFFNESILGYLEKKPRVMIEAADQSMIMYYSAKRIGAGELKPFLADAYEIYGLLAERSMQVG